MPHDKTNWPDWLKEAEISDDAIVEITDDGKVIWHGGVWEYGVWKEGTWKGGLWHDGIWNGGTWYCGIWFGGLWKDGIWKGGIWNNGTWKRGVWEYGNWNHGVWKGGIWNNGIWNDGVWKGGVWRHGVWNAKRNRLLYMASAIGIVFDPTTQTATAYRTTNSDGSGRFNEDFIQPEGEFYEDDLPPAGSGTCVKGIHVATKELAWRYFGEDPTAQLWKVTFHRKDLLDCDGEKARIRGGVFEKIDKGILK